jgi:hypothetical protein
MDRQYELEYFFSPDDLRASILDIGVHAELRDSLVDLQRSWVRRWPMATLIMALAPLGVLGLIEHIFAGRFTGAVWVLVGVVSTIGAVAYVYTDRWSRMLRKRQLRRMRHELNRRAMIPGFIGPCRVTLNEAGVMSYSIGGSEWIAWSSIQQVEHDPGDGYLALNTFTRRRMAIPARAAAHVAPIDEIARFVRECVEKSGGKATLISEYLAGAKLLCSKCQYPLSGHEQVTCPECGTEVDFRDLAESAPV